MKKTKAPDNQLYRMLVKDPTHRVCWTDENIKVLVDLVLARVIVSPWLTPTRHLINLMRDGKGLPPEFPVRKITTLSNCPAFKFAYAAAWKEFCAKAVAPPLPPAIEVVEVLTPIPIDANHLRTSVPKILLYGVVEEMKEEDRNRAIVESITPHLKEKPITPIHHRGPDLSSILAPKPEVESKIKFLVAGLLPHKQEKLVEKFKDTDVKFEFLNVGEHHAAKNLKKAAHHVFTINGFTQLNGIMRDQYGRSIVTSKDSPDELIQAVWDVYSQKVAERQHLPSMPINRVNGLLHNGNHRHEAAH